ncbi:LOW QUALITY PROTEIN: hypothetical protein ACHAW5_004030 [Stephanodiscus triporus]|uniref:DOMON domain-containing protein n=1 Tax=Stephanodiscus triporus TaxID=2934178 RepID=A0ABD3NQD9_9STRA
MKLLSAASTSTLLLLNGAASQTCPNVDEYAEMSVTEGATYNGALTFKYAIVLASSADDERSVLCARLETDSVGWMGFGISPSGMMDSGGSMKSTGIVGLPDDGSVRKYWLAADPRGVDPMDADRQTLMSASITRVEGTTIMEFTKYLREDGEYEIYPSGENTFLYALSGESTLGYHSAGEGSFMLDFAVETAPPVPAPVPDATPAAPLSGAVALTGAMNRSIAGSMSQNDDISPYVDVNLTDGDHNFVKGAFHTIDRPYNKIDPWGIIDFLHHKIVSMHVAHHFDTDAIKENFQEIYLYDPTLIPEVLVCKGCATMEKRGDYYIWDNRNVKDELLQSEYS